MLKTQKRKFKKSEKGMALIETIPVLFIVVVVFNFSLGFFGGVHSGILNSIASYNYTLETFRFKSNLMYFRPGGGKTHYYKSKNRVHGTVQDGSVASALEDKTNWPATTRGITLNYKKDDPTRGLIANGNGIESARNYAGNNSSDNIWNVKSESTPDGTNTVQTPRIWIKTIYGICLTADCGN